MSLAPLAAASCRAAGLSNVAHMGLLDTNLSCKPSYAEWERIFERPLDR